MATLDLGKIKQVWRGTYNNSTAYTVDDLVEYTDSGITSTYICVADSTGNAPSSSGTAHASWNYVAKGVADPLPVQSSSTNGKALVSDGTNATWGQSGTWTKIASGTGPSTEVDAFSIDNIFSDDYDYYKILYSFAENEWMYMRYIKADGSIESGGYYTWTTHGANEGSNGGEHGQWGGYLTQSHGIYHYWNGGDDDPALGEITLFRPYSSSYKTSDMYMTRSRDGTKLVHQIGANFLNVTSSIRGVYVWHTGSGNQLGTDFTYLVLGAKI